MSEKCYSTNNEDFTYDELEDAIRDVLDVIGMPIGTVVTVYEGDAVAWKAGDFAPTDVLDTLSCGAGDNAGEYADDWPNCTKEQEKELDQMIEDVINKWADDHGLQPNFYSVKDVKAIQVKLVGNDGEYEIMEPPENAL